MQFRAPQSVTHRLRRFLILVLPALLTAACASNPPVRIHESGLIIRSHGIRTADSTEDLVRELTPALMALDAGLEDRPVEIWLHESVATDAVYGGLDLEGRVHLEVRREHPRFSLAHELVHVFEGPQWDRLPAVMQEGLAEWCAAEVVPEVRAQMRVFRAAYLASWLGDGLPVPVPGGEDSGLTMKLSTDIRRPMNPDVALRIPRGGIGSAADGEMLRALYGFGYLLVERIGIHDLGDLCRRARAEGRDLVPPGWLLDAADLGPDPAGWWDAVLGMIAGDEEQALLHDMIDMKGFERSR